MRQARQRTDFGRGDGRRECRPHRGSVGLERRHLRGAAAGHGLVVAGASDPQDVVDLPAVVEVLKDEDRALDEGEHVLRDCEAVAESEVNRPKAIKDRGCPASGRETRNRQPPQSQRPQPASSNIVRAGMLRRRDALLRRTERRVMLDASLIRPPTRVPRMKALLKARRLRRLS